MIRTTTQHKKKTTTNLSQKPLNAETSQIPNKIATIEVLHRMLELELQFRSYHSQKGSPGPLRSQILLLISSTEPTLLHQTNHSVFYIIRDYKPMAETKHRQRKPKYQNLHSNIQHQT